MDHQISNMDNYLILQLKHFVNHSGDFIKGITKVYCTKTLVPLVANEMTFHKGLALYWQSAIQELFI